MNADFNAARNIATADIETIIEETLAIQKGERGLTTCNS